MNKINIAALREQAEIVIESSADYKNPETYDDYVLAVAILPLLDAVEAAEIVFKRGLDFPWEEDWDRLETALSCFDFGKSD